LAYTTIKGYLAAIKFAHKAIQQSTASFIDPLVEGLLHTVKKRYKSRILKPRLPITVMVLNDFLKFLDLDLYTHQLLFAVLTVGVYGLFRGGELTTKNKNSMILQRADVSWADDHCTITLRESKTDVLRLGVDVHIYKNGSPTCPYKALRRVYDAAPLKYPSAPLFQNADGSPLQYAALLRGIKALCIKLGFDAKRFGTHSLRIGGATTLAALRYPERMIKTLGRWKSISYELYARMLPADYQRVSTAFGAAPLSKEYFGDLTAEGASSLTFENIGLRYKLAQ
jgi:hypothetical protein